jgi:hypothetical protein
MPLISSILVGVAQGCSTTGYVSAPKKLATMDSSDLLRVQKLRVLARVTPTANVSTIRSGGGSYPELFNIQYANRVSVPLCRFQN